MKKYYITVLTEDNEFPIINLENNKVVYCDTLHSAEEYLEELQDDFPGIKFNINVDED